MKQKVLELFFEIKSFRVRHIFKLSKNSLMRKINFYEYSLDVLHIAMELFMLA